MGKWIGLDLALLIGLVTFIIGSMSHTVTVNQDGNLTVYNDLNFSAINVNTSFFIDTIIEFNLTQVLDIVQIKNGTEIKRYQKICSHNVPYEEPLTFFHQGAFDMNPTNNTIDPPVTEKEVDVGLTGTNITITHHESGKFSVSQVEKRGTKKDGKMIDFDPTMTSPYQQAVGLSLALKTTGNTVRSKRGAISSVQEEVKKKIDKYFYVRLKAMKVMGFIVASEVDSPSAHCLVHYHFKNCVKCFNQHYEGLMDKPIFQEVLGLFSEVMSLSYKIHFLRVKYADILES